VLLYNATGSNLEFGSHYPDAPKRFSTTRIFRKLWEAKGRVYLVVPVEHKEEVRARLPENSMWVLAETGGKTAYVNQPPIGSICQAHRCPHLHLPGTKRSLSRCAVTSARLVSKNESRARILLEFAGI